MGLEDLNLDLGEHAERILVIAQTADAAERIGRLLSQRAYVCRSATDLITASALAGEELFDMVVAEFASAELPPLDALDSITNDMQLRRSPILLLHPRADEITGEQLESLPVPVRVLGVPWEPSALLVRVSAELRLRKVRSDESGFVSRVAGQNAELRDLTTRFKRELQEAQYIQNSILPKCLPSAPGTRFAATYVPLEAVGGDLYDLWTIREDLFGLFIGDVTGHGLSAAFIGAMTKMALSYAEKASPDVMLGEMNRGLCAHMPEGRFVTAAAAFYSPSSGEIFVARAGHPPGYLYRAAEGKIQAISPRGMPLGVLTESRYELYSTRLEPGDQFLFVTDGLTETTNLSGSALGVEGTAELYRGLAQGNRIDACLSGLLELQEQYSEGRIVKDDITLVGLERLA